MRRILSLIAKLLFTSGLLYIALGKVDFRELAARIDLGTLGWLTFAILLNYATHWIGAIRWRLIGDVCDAPLSNGLAFRFNMIGMFFSQALPSSIGGDAIRLWLLARKGAGWRTAAYSVLVDRAFGLLSLALLILLTLPWSYALIADPIGRSTMIAIDLSTLVACAAFLMLGSVREGWVTRTLFLHQMHACAVIANALAFNRKTGPYIAFLSVLIHILTVAIMWCTVRSIAAPGTFWQLLLIIPPVIIVTMIPLSIAGWGLREASMGLAFAYAGLAANEGVQVSLLYGLTSFLVGASGGLIWILSSEKRMPLTREP